MKRRLEIARGLLHTPQNPLPRRADTRARSAEPQPALESCEALNETEKTTVFLTTHYMDEADRVAHRIAIIDHGAIVAQGTPAELKQQTATDSLEGAFLALTGSTLRDESRQNSAGRRCAKSQRCGGGKSDGRDLHSLAARIEAIRALARADSRLSRASRAFICWRWASDRARSSARPAMAAICSSWRRA